MKKLIEELEQLIEGKNFESNPNSFVKAINDGIFAHLKSALRGKISGKPDQNEVSGKGFKQKGILDFDVDDDRIMIHLTTKGSGRSIEISASMEKPRSDEDLADFNAKFAMTSDPSKIAARIAKGLLSDSGLKEEKDPVELDEAFNAQKMESSIEKTLIKYAKGMKAEGNDGITPTFLGEVITRLDKVSPGLAKWTKHHIKA